MKIIKVKSTEVPFMAKGDLTYVTVYSIPEITFYKFTIGDITWEKEKKKKKKK